MEITTEQMDMAMRKVGELSARNKLLEAVYEAACLVHDLTGYSLMEDTVIPAPQDVHIKLDEALDAVQTRQTHWACPTCTRVNPPTRKMCVNGCGRNQ